MHPRRFTLRHVRIAGALVVAVCVLLLTRSPLYGLGVLLGPFAGGVARDWQSCCARNSLALAPYGIAGLLAGCAVQLAVSPRTPTRVWIRRIAWGLGCATWFACALLSYGHALE